VELLLDTHVLIWAAISPEKLSAKITDLILNKDSNLFLSLVSFWEIAIKISIGKADIDFNTLLRHIPVLGVQTIQMENEHFTTLLNLPNIHKDPFDRYLISLALKEKLTIITADENIQKYDVAWIW
jgi:PIN domain nuclease of toxin-antitoxin system